MYMKVRVKAGASHESVERLGTTFIVSVRESAERNRANVRVRELIARELMVPLSTVRLISGHNRPNKKFEILRA